MVKLFSFILFFSSLTLRAQQVDSISQARKNTQQKLYDSLVQIQQQKAKADIEAKQEISKKKLTLALEKENQSLKGSKEKVRTATDSSAQAAYKTQGKAILKEEVKPLGVVNARATINGQVPISSSFS